MHGATGAHWPGAWLMSHALGQVAPSRLVGLCQTWRVSLCTKYRECLYNVCNNKRCQLQRPCMGATASTQANIATAHAHTHTRTHTHTHTHTLKAPNQTGDPACTRNRAAVISTICTVPRPRHRGTLRPPRREATGRCSGAALRALGRQARWGGAERAAAPATRRMCSAGCGPRTACAASR